MSDVNDIKVKIIGVGGGGNNAVKNIIKKKYTNVECYLLNTDINGQKEKSKNFIQIGKVITSGFGSGANEEVGENAALESSNEIKNILENTDLLFLTCGMGGGTGTGATPVVARIAKEMGIYIIAIVTKPFKFEGLKRLKRAEKGIENLKKYADLLVVVSNDLLIKNTTNDITLVNAFEKVDDVLNQGICSVSDLINKNGEINVDFSDLKTILSYNGLGYLGLGKASGDNKLEIATKNAIENPLTENKLDNAKGLIVNITGNHTLSLIDIESVVTKLNERVSSQADVVFGLVNDDSIGDEVMVTVIATGVNI